METRGSASTARGGVWPIRHSRPLHDLYMVAASFRSCGVNDGSECEGANAKCISYTGTPILISNRPQFRRGFFSSCMVGRGANAARLAAGEAPRPGTRQLLRCYARRLSPASSRALVRYRPRRSRGAVWMIAPGSERGEVATRVPVLGDVSLQPKPGVLPRFRTVSRVPYFLHY
jgi:hypothetical protein